MKGPHAVQAILLKLAKGPTMLNCITPVGQHKSEYTMATWVDLLVRAAQHEKGQKFLGDMVAMVRLLLLVLQCIQEQPQSVHSRCVGCRGLV